MVYSLPVVVVVVVVDDVTVNPVLPVVGVVVGVVEVEVGVVGDVVVESVTTQEQADEIFDGVAPQLETKLGSDAVYMVVV